MREDPRERVTRFLATWLHPDKKAQQVGLNQVLEAERSSPLSVRAVAPVRDEQARADAARLLAHEIVEEAETWAELVPRARVLFTVAVFDTADPNRPPLTHAPFLVTKEGDFARAEGDLADPLAAAGMMARNAVDLIRIGSGNQQEQIQDYRAEVQQLRAYIAEQDRARHAYLMERERLLDGAAERDLRVREGKLYADMKEQGFQLLFAFLASKVAGGESPKTTVTVEQVVRFARCLTREQAELAKPLVEDVYARLAPEQKQELVRLHKLAAEGKFPADAMLNGAPAAVEGRPS